MINETGSHDAPGHWMNAPTKQIQVTLETELESVDLAEDITVRVADAAGFDEEDCHKIGMSVREGVINAFQYGNQKQREKKIYLSFALEAEVLVIHILDQGHGFEVKEVADPLAVENLLKTSGRGIFLMRAFMDNFEVRRGNGGGAELVMSKKYPDASSNGRGTKRV
jgi:serine/threonine-protein kinase RsbW